MDMPSWFDEIPVLGKLPPERAAVKLREVGEEDVASVLEAAVQRSGRAKVPQAMSPLDWVRIWPRGRTVQHTGHAFGHLAPAPPGDQPLPIRHAGNIPADPTLQGSRIKVTLDGLSAADYPGRGSHRVLFDFYAQNQLPDNVEHVHFNSTFRIREGQRAAVIGYPVFVGLTVGTEGLAFRCFTVNVQNDEDEGLLGLMESDVFKAGLKLVSVVQPAIAPLSGMAVALTKSIAGRHRNVPVQDFFLGLDFSDVSTRARLAEGSYIAVQIPEERQLVWKWEDWVYHPGSGQVVRKDDATQLIPYNYVILGVSRYREQRYQETGWNG
jgi:hypothetical protein